MPKVNVYNIENDFGNCDDDELEFVAIDDDEFYASLLEENTTFYNRKTDEFIWTDMSYYRYGHTDRFAEATEESITEEREFFNR